MPPKKTSTANGKRKATTSASEPSSKKAKATSNEESTATNGEAHTNGGPSDDSHGVVLRKYYPAEMSNARCKSYINNEIPRPIEELKDALSETKSDRDAIKVNEAVVHWFKYDLRTQDNHGLHLAAQKAKEGKVPLICLYIVSPQDFEAHLTAPVRVDFILRTLEVLKKDLADLDIPLVVETVEKRKNIPARILELCSEWGANHIYANVEYEVDELRREAKLTRSCVENGISFNAVEDTCVVAPGEILAASSGKPYAVYTPWWRTWCKHLNSKPTDLNLYDAPGKNPSNTREIFKPLFDSTIPSAPENKQLTPEEKKRFKSMWPPGEHEAQDRLQKFVKERIKNYSATRNFPAQNGTATLSVHFAAGTLSARTAVYRAREASGTKKVDSGSEGLVTWISEVAWRDFYKHVMAHWPFVCMNKPFKPEYTNIQWSYNDAHFNAWTTGHTGYPFIDAAMRQLLHTGYMHNRPRMAVASFLAKDLLLDWRLGEQYFMLHLIDGDFASNNGGWGFSSSTGVDPQPYFRIFNPLSQSERFDEGGEYIRKWVPELKDIKGKAIHDPYGRGMGKEAKKAGYSEMIVEHKGARERALRSYKEGLGRDTA